MPLQTPPTPPTLRFTEWILTGSLLFLIVTLVLIAKMQSHRLSAETVVALPPVEVLIEGEVSKPGSYQIAPGTPFAEVLRKARPTRLADLNGLDQEERVKKPLRIEIKALEKLSVAIEGEITEPGLLIVPIGTRMCDLKKYVTLKPSADPTFFKKRRLLKQGEKITIPQGKQEN
jgi:hypothetical protein